MEIKLIAPGMILLILLGCAATPGPDMYSASAGVHGSGRYLVRSANLSLEVKDVSLASNAIVEYANEAGGYIELNARRSEESVSIGVRVPEAKLDSFMGKLTSLGTVKSKNLSTRDVTDDVIDVEARLSNLISLRDRFRKLLSRAEKVSEVLEIERELSRIQTEIDAIEGRKSKLMGQINHSEVQIHLDRKTTYGPLGYIAIGIYWVIEKLFVIQ